MSRFWTLVCAFILSFLPPGYAKEANLSEYNLGKDVYNYRCYFCHGYSGDAKTLAAELLAVKPTDFTGLEMKTTDRLAMIDVVKHGREGTPMVSFKRLLNDEKIEAVVDFVRTEFIKNKHRNTRYHTEENGWKDHQQYAIAFPFATGEIALDTPAENLTKGQKHGHRLFMLNCITCHDKAKVDNPGAYWSSEALSYPRNQYDHRNPPVLYDGISSASIYAYHELEPSVDLADETEELGLNLYQQNCAFCHGADGKGKNWIGSFLTPRPRDLSNPEFMLTIDRAKLASSIGDGIANTSMPAWRLVLNPDEINAIISYINIAFHPVQDPPISPGISQ